jgi:hypothetical protein
MRFLNINEKSDNVLIYEGAFEQMLFPNSKNKIVNFMVINVS